MVRNFGSFPLTYHTLQPDLSLYQLPGCGYLAYRRALRTNYVIGDPIADPNWTSDLLDAYLTDNPHSVFIQIHQPTAFYLKSRGYRVSRFGVETELTLPYHLSGGNRADIRHLCNRAEAHGLQVQELDLPARQADDAQALLHGATGSRRQFTRPFRFLARSGLPLDDTNIRVFGAYHAERLVGLSVFDPMWTDGRITGYAEVIPRRAFDAPKGTRSLVLLRAMAQFADEGIASVNLGLSPLAFDGTVDDRAADANATEWLLGQIFRYGSWGFNFKGLAFHKQRFRGNEQTVYLASKSTLPLIALWQIYRLTTGTLVPPLPRLFR